MSDEPVLSRLLPGPGAHTPSEMFDEVSFADLASPDRPYVVVNMVTTLDGAAAVDGKSAPISDPADRAVFHQLRASVDAVLVGAGTARTEGYGRLVPAAHHRALRVRRGLAADPIAVLVTNSLDVPTDLPLLADEHSHVVVLTGSTGSLPRCAARVDYLRAENGLDLGVLLARLRAEHGVRSVLCEGGPRLNGSLLPSGLIDEFFLTIAPILAGERGARRIVEGAEIPEPIRSTPSWLYSHDGVLFGRYALVRG